jgi:hypothetical protein
MGACTDFDSRVKVTWYELCQTLVVLVGVDDARLQGCRIIRVRLFHRRHIYEEQDAQRQWGHGRELATKQDSPTQLTKGSFALI